MMSSIDIAWVAGIIEGEGSIIIPEDKNSQVNIIVGMTDEDVINRLQSVTGMGTVRSSWTKKGNKQNYKWGVYKQRDVARLLLAIAPMMGIRRRTRIMEAADILHERFGVRNCIACGIQFRSDHISTIYCSPNCNTRMYIKKHKKDFYSWIPKSLSCP